LIRLRFRLGEVAEQVRGQSLKNRDLGLEGSAAVRSGAKLPKCGEKRGRSRKKRITCAGQVEKGA